MAKLIGFSGACNSSKTTTIREIKKHFGNRIIVMEEVIRKSAVTDIDQLRRDPQAYLEFQIKVIHEKFETEQQALREHTQNSVILTDRSLADSFFYYVFYMDKAKFSRQQLEKYTDFFKWLYFRTLTSAKCYDHIFLFRPLNITEFDPLRPGNLDLLQDVEFFFIKTLVFGFYPHTNITEVSADNETDVNTIYSIIDAYVTKS
jgi:hypothetical protein